MIKVITWIVGLITIGLFLCLASAFTFPQFVVKYWPSWEYDKYWVHLAGLVIFAILVSIWVTLMDKATDPYPCD